MNSLLWSTRIVLGNPTSVERHAQFLHREVRRLRQQCEDQLRLLLDPAGPSIPAERPGANVALLPLERPPAAHARGAHPEPHRGLPPDA